MAEPSNATPTGDQHSATASEPLFGPGLLRADGPIGYAGEGVPLGMPRG